MLSVECLIRVVQNLTKSVCAIANWKCIHLHDNYIVELIGLSADKSEEERVGGGCWKKFNHGRPAGLERASLLESSQPSFASANAIFVD